MYRWMEDKQVGVRLVRPRKTKSGDFRPPRHGLPSRITLNSDLSPVDMMITFCHEWAHYLVYNAYQRRAKPHGEEWKQAFRGLLAEVLEQVDLPHGIPEAIRKCYFKRERIGSGICEALYDAERELHIRQNGGVGSQDPGGIRVRDLAEGQEFRLRGGKVFVKGRKNRTRYRCREVKTGRMFTVHSMAEVLEIISR